MTQKPSIKYPCSWNRLCLDVFSFNKVPVALKNAAEVFCIGQTSNKIWKSEKNHADANMLAVQRCNERNQKDSYVRLQAKLDKKTKNLTLA